LITRHWRLGGQILALILIVWAVTTIAINHGNQTTEETTEKPRELQNVTFGVIVSDVNASARYIYAVNTAIQDLNDYCIANEIPRNFTYKSIITTYSNTSLTWIQKMKKEGVQIFFESPLNSPICSSDTYINVNSLSMVGAPQGYGFCPSHNRIDFIYRVSPNETENTSALPTMLRVSGVKAVIVIQLDDGTADRIQKLVDELLRDETTGIEVSRVVEIGFTEAPQEEYIEADRRNSESLMAEVSSTLAELSKTYPLDEVGILYAGLTTNPRHIAAVGNHPDLLNVTWYGTSHLTMSRGYLTAYGNVTSRIHLLSPQPELSLGENPVYLRLEAGYEETADYGLDEVKLGVAEASLYDALWVAARSVIRAGSTDAKAIQGVFIDEAGKYSGATGRIVLDKNGDRIKVDQLICGFYLVEGAPQWIPVGRFYAEKGIIELLH
jgi:hypothetical protein